MFKVTKKFTNGFMKGLTITETTSVEFKPGKEYKACAGSDYIVISCERI